MTHILSFAQAAEAGPRLAGGKGWNTGRLAAFGFPVPRGCVVTVDAYWYLLDRQVPASLRREVAGWTAMEAASPAAADLLATVRQHIADGPLPPGLTAGLQQHLREEGIPADAGLAVRSSATAEDSATASFAGIHRSCLNVQGEEQLAQAIRTCYASLWTPTAVTYRRRLGLDECQVGAALVVQELILAFYSGVAFSADPMTGRRDRVVINAAFGLGEAVVAGSVEADEYHLHIDHTGPVKLVGGRIGLKHHTVKPALDGGTIVEELGYEERSQPVLGKPLLEELTRVVRRIQDTLGGGQQAQDVEWCHDGWRLVVTQARPITALPEATFSALTGQPTLWSNANLKDAMPGVQSPLGWWFNSLTVEVLLRQIFWRAGYDLPEGLTWSRLHHGRAYMNLSALQWAAFDAFGWQPGETNRALGGHQPEIGTPPPAPLLSRVGWARFRRMLRMGLLLRRAARNAEQTFRRVWDWCAAFEEQPFSDRYHELDFLHRLWAVEKQRREFLPETMIHNVGGLWSTRLAELLERRLPGRGRALASALLAGAEGITSADQGLRLVTIARQALEEPAACAYFRREPFQTSMYRTCLQGTATLRELDRFLQEFGHRGVYEMELMNPRWSEDPAYPLAILRSYVTKGLPSTDPAAAAAAKRQAAEAEAARAFRFSPAYPLYRFLLRKSREAMRLRESAKSALVRLVRPARLTALAIGRRLAGRGLLAQPEDLFFLTGDEIASLLSAQWDGKGIPAILAQRREQRAAWEALSAPDVIQGERAVVNLHLGTAAAGLQTGGEAVPATVAGSGGGMPPLQGVAVSSGRASGRARLIRRPEEGAALQPGEVLVAPSTDPAWTPLFLRASAIVMEVGGYLSHGAIVAREYGIPAVVNLAGAMSTLRDGELVEVNGDTGQVRLLHP